MARRSKPGDLFSILKDAVRDFSKDDAVTLGAAVSFYAALSLAPLLLLLLWVSSLFGPDLQQGVVDELTRLVGPQVGQTVRLVMANARERPNVATLSGVVGLGSLVVGATAVFAELQHAMNVIWNVQDPKRGVAGFLRKRALSMLLVLAIGGVLVLSMLASTALTAVATMFAGTIVGLSFLIHGADVLVSLAVYALVFAAMFRVLPDVDVSWRHVTGGAVVTAVLFVIGKTLVGLYLARNATASSYGAAGSLIVLLLWVYYSALIVFFGAEITQSWTARRVASAT